MFVFGVLANAARHEPEAVAALTRGDRGARSAGRVTRLLRIPPPRPYRVPGARAQAGGLAR
jgi:cell division protein FtsW